MWKFIIPLAILIVLAVVVRLLDVLLRSRKPRFDYARRDCLMTPAERECFIALLSEMGQDYHFFPQIHLDAIVTSAQAGGDRFHAFRHINQKSVDFVACSKTTLQPLFVIEVDDRTHRQSKRIERDQEVERILHGAGIPLIRIENHGRFDGKELAEIVSFRFKKFGNRSSVDNKAQNLT
jgi:very-short-patch-repair endonuclease